jgi:ATP-dependent Clp protease ATP-binding subunit ClpX
LEGTEANVPPNGGRKHPHQQFLKIDTTNILFICGGAFEGIETLVKRRIGENGIGFGADISSRREKSSKEVLSQIIPQDLLSFGLIPEFVGRLPIIVTLEPLDESSLVSILTSPKNALANQYKKIMEMEGVSLEFKEDALRAIAGEAFKRNMGARGLRAVMEDIMLDIMFDIPSLLDISKVIITRDVVEKKQEPILIRDNQKTAEYIGKRIDIWV